MESNHDLYYELWTKEGNIEMNLRQAREEGRDQVREEVAIRMLNEGYTLEQTSQVTLLSVDDLKRLKEE